MDEDTEAQGACCGSSISGGWGPGGCQRRKLEEASREIRGETLLLVKGATSAKALG